MNKKNYWILTVVLALLLAACTPEKGPRETTQNPTVENVFTQPSTTVTEPGEDSGDLGSLRVSLTTWETDDMGCYLNYTGAEMPLTLSMEASGKVRENGIGFLLFVDGLPQPYRTADEDYAYLHTFYPQSENSCQVELIFTPITGKSGDNLEMYCVSVLNPDFSFTEDDYTGPVYTSWAPPIGFRLNYQQTPPAEVFPQGSPRLSQPEIRKEPLSYSEVGTWTEQDLLESIETHLYANGVTDTRTPCVFGIKESQPIHLRYEVFGSPYVRYHLVFFVDNQPVASREGTPILVDVETGQKTVVEAQLDMTGFDTESVLYAVLVPQNYFSTPVRTNAFAVPSSPIFLLEGAKEDYIP